MMGGGWQRAAAWLSRIRWPRSRPLAGRRCIFCDERPPAARLGSGFPRAEQLVRALLELGAEVTIVALKPEDPRYLPYETAIPRGAAMAAGRGVEVLERLLRMGSERWSDLIVSRPSTLEQVQPLLKTSPDLLTGVNLIYDAEAIFALRETVRQRVAGRVRTSEEAEEAVAREVALCQGASAVMSVSSGEAGHFRRFGLSPLVVGHAIEPLASPAGFASRRDVLFIGSIHGNNGPNYDAITWFLKGVWPGLAVQLPEARCIIAGLNLASNLTAAQLPERVIMTGALEDLTPLYQSARLFIAPTRFAAGIPIKIIEAAAAGVPVVCTSLLAAQLGWSPGQELTVGDTPEDFAAGCIQLYRDRARWRRQQVSAQRRVRREYSPRVFRRQVEELFAAVAARRVVGG